MPLLLSKSWGSRQQHMNVVSTVVDNFKVAGPNIEIIQDLLNAIGGKKKITIEKEVLTYYNGIDYKQTCEYIKMHAITYLTNILKNHNWECCPKDEEKIIETIHPTSIKELESTARPDLEAESKQLEADEDSAHHLHNVITRQSNICVVILDKHRIGDLSIGDNNPVWKCQKEDT
eukprot:5181565-Ditylum_brightwellii.AAC.1